MRKIIVLTFISLDGVMQAPGGKGEDPSGGFDLEGWTVPFFDQQNADLMTKQMTPPFDLLLGKKTYEVFASYWPDHDDEVANIFNPAKKYVVSNTKVNLTWNNSERIDSDVINKIKKLKSEDGPDIQVHGSGVLIQTLLQNDLVDEFWLKIFPITLGKGKKLFASGTIPASFKLTDCQATPSGVIFATYKRDGALKLGSF
jgi:dihydrofolate reductase